MISLKKSLPFIFNVLLTLGILVPTIVILVEPSSIIKNTYKNISNYSEVVLPHELNYDDIKTKNALKIDAHEKSKSNSAIVYYISWIAIFHKFSFLTHILSVLEQNANKEIYVFTFENVFNLSFLSSYPNVKIFTILQYPTYTIDNLDKIDDSLAKTIDYLYVKNKLIDFYSDDYLILKNAELILDTDYINSNYLKKIISKLSSVLYKTNSINLFADGTASTSFWSTNFYNWFGIYENNYNMQSNAFDRVVSEFNRYKSKVRNNTFNIDEDLKDYRDIFYFFMSPLVTHVKSNDYTNTKFFLPSAQMVIDQNNNSDIDRNLIKPTPTNFFDPYNSLSSGLINLIKELNPKSFSDLLIALKTNRTSLSRDDAEFSFMDNNINYIYSGRNLIPLNTEELDKECNKLYMLYKIATSPFYSDTIKKFTPPYLNIIFKPHPSDNSEQTVLTTLKTNMSKLYPNEFPTVSDVGWLYTINKNIPFELYIGSKIFEDYPAKNRIVNIFGTLSTIFLMTYDYNLSANISHFLLTSPDEIYINNSFGQNSKLFPKSKRVKI